MAWYLIKHSDSLTVLRYKHLNFQQQFLALSTLVLRVQSADADWLVFLFTSISRLQASLSRAHLITSGIQRTRLQSERS
jgi:hypothetical protein